MKGIVMRLAYTLSSVCVVVALSACSTTTTTPVAPVAVAHPTFQAKVTQFGNPQVDEAASAYVSHYKQTVEESLQSGKYQRALAVKYLNAESCFDSRSSRLLAKTLTPAEKAGLVKAYVAPEKMHAYEKLAQGHFMRPNGLETFSCEIAGLTVDRSNVRY
ncbi:MAG: hypothetical protein KDF54_06745 [Hydrogenophaga sp.]|nr:hypothetical protein [Hydrogenophaga sp.]